MPNLLIVSQLKASWKPSLGVMRFYCKCLAAARACASRYHCREAARRLGRPCTLLLGKAGAAWCAGGSRYVRPLPLLPWPSACQLPPLRRLSAIHHGLAAITIRTEKRRRGARGGTGWAPGGGAATGHWPAAAGDCRPDCGNHADAQWSTYIWR